ncbi:tetratricopeptide repeat protein [Thalassomonas haliotis]|uniref:Tetratricopeptide repeat protein n=1 Tax=Thalassomonas haliotis TaxID=485448 RepID=A0ABY7VDL1_9GAMM|nr:tetratricopeptide repeat protein [Thalassomonas haliotis]WDE11482.1 tetratricopeptide repeat protein [Thalassomonas haliotis]
MDLFANLFQTVFLLNTTEITLILLAVALVIILLNQKPILSGIKSLGGPLFKWLWLHIQRLLPAKQQESIFNKEVCSVLNQARGFRLKGQFTEAKSMYQKVIDKVEVYLDEAAVVFEHEHDDKLVCAQAYLDAGHDCQNRGEFSHALEHYRHSRELTPGTDEKSKICHASATSASAFIHHVQGDDAAALQEFNQARQVFEQLDERLGVAGTYKGLARISYVAGHLQDALSYYNQAYGEYVEAKDSFGQAQVRLGIGGIYLAQGLTERAQYEFDQAYDIFKNDSNLRGLASTIFNYALLDLDRHKIATALGELQTANVFFTFIESKFEQANAYLLLGQSLVQTMKLDDAEEALEKAYKLYKKMGVSSGLGHVDYSRGNLKLAANHHTLARQYYSKAIERYPNNLSKAQALRSLGNSYFITGDFQLAEQNYRTGLQICMNLNCRKDESKLRRKLGYLAMVQGNFEEAGMFFNSSLESLPADNAEEKTLGLLYKAMLIIEKCYDISEELTENRKTAFEYHMQSAGEEYHQALRLYIYGRYYLLKGKHFTARECLLTAKSHFELNNQLCWLFRCYYALGKNELENGLINLSAHTRENSLHYLRPGYQLAQQMQCQRAVSLFKILIEQLR